MSLSFRAGADTHVGRVRSSNQDSLLEAGDLFVVADGMGGHNGGEVASALAVETVRETFNAPTTDVLVEAIQAANEAILAKASEDPSLQGMGTTVVALAAVVTDGEERIAIANVGDSRCYLLEDDRLRQITKDHSVVQTLVDNGQITKAEAEVHPQRNILTRALGIDPKVMTDSWELLPFAGDRYLLCSDGLFNEVSPTTIIETLQAQTNPSEAAAELVRLANEGGGRDNISVVIVDVLEDGGRRAAADEALSRVAVAETGVHRAMRHAGVLDPGGGESTGDDAQPSDDEGGGGDEDDEARSGVSFRTIAFIGALVAVGVGVLGVLAFATRSTYYVGFDDDVVVIFQGRPDGFLGMDPSVKERTDLRRTEVPPSFLDELDDGAEFGSLDDARQYVDRLQAEADENPVRRTATTVPPPVTRPSDPDDTTPDPDAGGLTPSDDGDPDGDPDGEDPSDTEPGDGDPDGEDPSDTEPGETTPPTTEDDGRGSGLIGAVAALVAR
jgi:protein phosphatase